MQQAGGDAFRAGFLLGAADLVSAVVVLGLFSLLTGLLSIIVTPVASVVLTIQVAADTAYRFVANEFAFLVGCCSRPVPCS